MYQIKTNNGKIYEVIYNGRIIYYVGNINKALHLINKGVIKV